jgi:hypothetical protein
MIDAFCALRPPQLAASLAPRCSVLFDAHAVANHSTDSGQDDRRWYTDSSAESSNAYSTKKYSDERANDYSIDRPTKLFRPRLSETANRVGTAFDCMLHCPISRAARPSIGGPFPLVSISALAADFLLLAIARVTMGLQACATGYKD